MMTSETERTTNSCTGGLRGCCQHDGRHFIKMDSAIARDIQLYYTTT